jgi:hypothetical protein
MDSNQREMIFFMCFLTGFALLLIGGVIYVGGADYFSDTGKVWISVILIVIAIIVIALDLMCIHAWVTYED